ncbi:MAG: hypothetical protein NVSMB5_07780 [Candidatus Velthaea sp.]
MTQDIDCFASAPDYQLARTRLTLNGYHNDGELAFPSSSLGLFGSRWTPEGSGPPIDLISTEQSWGLGVFSETAQFTKEGDRVIPLAYLVLMKLDAARSGDQFDLSRMLGRLNEHELDDVAATVKKYYGHDPSAIEDLRQMAEIGRWEYENENVNPPR